jgi:hypothetical protein
MYIMNYMIFVLGVQFKEYMYLYLENYLFYPFTSGATSCCIQNYQFLQPSHPNWLGTCISIKKSVRLGLILLAQISFLVKWYGHASVFHVWAICKSSNITG